MQLISVTYFPRFHPFLYPFHKIYDIMSHLHKLHFQAYFLFFSYCGK